MSTKNELQSPTSGVRRSIGSSAKALKDDLERLAAEERRRRQRFQEAKLKAKRALTLAEAEERRATNIRQQEEEKRLRLMIGALVLGRIQELGIARFQFGPLDLQSLSDPDKLLFSEYLDRHFGTRNGEEPGRNGDTVDLPL